MNPHIELAKKFLADDTSVSLEELKVNKDVAYDTWVAAYEAAWAAAYWAYRAAYWVFRGAEADNYVENVECYKRLAIKAVKEYEELTK